MNHREKIKSQILIGLLFFIFLTPFHIQSQTTFKMPTRPYGAVITDYDLDGDNDIIVGCHALSSSDPDSIIIMFNDGWGNFEKQGFEKTKNGIFIYCQDLNNDIYPDIISRDADSIFYLENNKQGGLGNEYKICHTIGNRRIGGIADMDENGYLDIVYYGILVIRGWGIVYNIDGFTFNDEYNYYTEDNEFISVGHLNNDSIPDVLVSDLSAPEVSYAMYNNIDTFQQEIISTRHWTTNYIIDINNDNQNEAVFERHSPFYYTDGWLYFFEKGSDENYILVDSTAIHGGSIIGTFDDFDQDGYQDFAVTVSSWDPHPSEDSVYFYRNNQNWGFELWDKRYIGDWFYPSIISGDLNMDGYPDAVTIGYLNPTSNHIQILWNDGTGHFIDTNNVYVSKFEYDLKRDIKLFPNPTDRVLNVTSNRFRMLEISIYDIDGKLAVNKKLNNTKKISIDLVRKNLKPGFYICCIRLENSTLIYKKLIIN